MVTRRAERRARRWYNRTVRALAMENRELCRRYAAGETDYIGSAIDEPRVVHGFREYAWPFDATQCARGRGEARAWQCRRHVVRGAFGIDDFHLAF